VPRQRIGAVSRFRVALAGAAVLTAAVVGTARSADPLPPLVLDAPTPAPLLGFAPAGGYEQSLVRLDPQTLARSGRRFVATGDQNFGWSFSPDRSRLVLGSTSGTLQLVDTRKLRSLGYVDTGVYELVQATQWVGSRQVVAAVAACCGLGPMTLVAVNTVKRKVVARRQLSGSIQAAAHVPKGLVLLLGPNVGVGPSRLAVVGPRAMVRTVALDRIRSGQDRGTEASPIVAYSSPALVTDPDGRTAYVVSSGSEAAEIDLGTLAVSYHSLSRPVSLLGRVDRWLEAPAQAKGAPDGPTRNAIWLGNGVLAVYGTDDHGTVDAAGVPQLTSTPSGLQLVNTNDWSVRTLDADADTAAVAEDALVTTGSVWHSDTQTNTGTGLTIFDADGAIRAHLFGTRPLWFETVGSRVFVPFAPWPGGDGYDVVDVKLGEVVATIHDRPLPIVLGSRPWPY
jgi:hypothetical protein